MQSPLAGGCMTMTFCPLRPRIQRIYCPTHADLSLPPSGQERRRSPPGHSRGGYAGAGLGGGRGQGPVPI